jgi:tRNA(His) guanylyltransferase
MKFDDLDQKMRTFETLNDSYFLPEMFLVARIDGRNFTQLTRDRHPFEAPYDPNFRDYMTTTVEHLMSCGFKVTYGYTQSDEISLLFDFAENSFSRKERKFNSVLAGEASAKFSVLLKDTACFDCRICQFPNASLVVDYFRRRSEDAHRNALNAHCYWMLRKQKLNARQATKQLLGMSVAEKNELLFQSGINFNKLPAWQKRGVGLYWETYQKTGVNPKTGEEKIASRNRIKVDYDLPMKEAYSDFIRDLVTQSSGSND